jgi:hypothetical protein
VVLCVTAKLLAVTQRTTKIPQRAKKFQSACQKIAKIFSTARAFIKRYASNQTGINNSKKLIKT